MTLEMYRELLLHCVAVYVFLSFPLFALYFARLREWSSAMLMLFVLVFMIYSFWLLGYEPLVRLVQAVVK